MAIDIEEISEELTDIINAIFDGEMSADKEVQSRLVLLRDKIEGVVN